MNTLGGSRDPVSRVVPNHPFARECIARRWTSPFFPSRSFSFHRDTGGEFIRGWGIGGRVAGGSTRQEFGIERVE